MTQTLEDTVRLLKAAADPTRLRLLALCQRGETTVSELVAILGQSQPRISRHLKLLCDAGLLERFRDGHWIYYRAPATGTAAASVRRVMELLPEETVELARDAERAIAGHQGAVSADPTPLTPAERGLHRAVLDALLTAPVGRLLDIGTGSARMLKLLGRRASRAVGVDTDAGKRLQARAELAVAGLGNCSIRPGDAHGLDFPAGSFDTVILDELLGRSESPDRVVVEAARVLAPGGRLIVIEALSGKSVRGAGGQMAALAASAGLALGRPRAVPAVDPNWLVAVAVAAGSDSKVA
ncbi:MAG: metalloregulator ArsR/SmtB family transcription factor [Gammaproteobacteria bacterium]